ncbi:LacI family DNA-binding transcriptional regulator [Rhodohalobacter sulfatireducens]|uniref:LacI family transcriptional regulator n=1 Tax=Rhodohalobacter sulfatireducens TaxID=2911366 RepID=A0ABS9KEH1_9BACT|nr:LacI family DNA-binding transcriptional regulator [Rhodohalobacter sulfatireducens]MCG2589223.1 LacI family transcriptional regulator [Rhodohalobacter sulfatireducens]
MEKLNIDKVAKLAHVSRSVVSRVLNNHPNVSDEARSRVMSVVEEYNYRPNSVARSLATSSTYQIGVLSGIFGEESLGNGYWTLLYLGIFEECIRNGYYVRLSFYNSEMKKELHDLILNEHHLDGVICLNEEVTEFTLQTFEDSDIPIVLVGHNPKYPEIPSVDVDNYDAAYKATDHLVQLGHKDIGGMFGDQNVQETEHRMRGYQDALCNAGIEPKDDYTAVGSYSQHDGHDTMEEWIKKHDDMTAVFCASDTLAMGTLLALFENDISVPEQFSVVGFDGLPISKYMIPPLTTVAQPTYGKGEKAAKLLIEKIKNKDARVRHASLKPELLVRKSTAKLS